MDWYPDYNRYHNITEIAIIGHYGNVEPNELFRNYIGIELGDNLLSFSYYENYNNFFKEGLTKEIYSAQNNVVVFE